MSLGAGNFILVPVATVAVATGESVFVPMPYRGKVLGIQATIEAAITGDLTITAEIGGTAITGLTTVHTASGSAAGDVETGAPTATTKDAAGGFFNAGQPVEVIFDGNPSAGGNCVCMLIVGAQ